MLRQRAGQGQQMAAKGAGPAQVGAQVGQVRQPFKGGGGLRQMVQLPTNRVQFGKTAYQDVTDPQASGFSNLLSGIGRNFEESRERERLRNQRARVGPGMQILNYFGFNDGTVEKGEAMEQEADKITQQMASIGAAPAALADDGDGGIAAEVEALSGSLGEAPKAPAQVDDSAPDKKKEGTKLYRSPEEAAYASLIDSDAGQKAAKRYFAGENVALANISEALRAYKGYKDTEQKQIQKINEANIKRAASERAIEKERLERGLTQAQIRKELFAPKADLLKGYESFIDAAKEELKGMGPGDPKRPELLAKIANARGQLQKILSSGVGSEALAKLATAQGIAGTNLPIRTAKKT